MVASSALETMLCYIVLGLSLHSIHCFTFHVKSNCKSIAALRRYERDRPSPTSGTLTPNSHLSEIRMARNDKNDNDIETPPPVSPSINIKLFELDDAFADDGENVVGTKFFGGSSVKEELYVPEEEERALELQNVKDIEYSRFEDTNSFGDALGKRVGMALQMAINQILYDDNEKYNRGEEGDENDRVSVPIWKEDATLKWETPFSLTKNAGGTASSPLTELAASKSFYNKLDLAILSASTIKSEGTKSVLDVRWEIGLVWPNFWESRAILTGTSILTISNDVENNCIVLLRQQDALDGGNPTDIVGALSSQLTPRFWDIYHIGMTPSAEFSPRYDSLLPSSSSQSLSKRNKGKKGIFSNYRLSYLPPRLVIEPSLIDTNGREARTAQVLPNHGFTTAIKTMGPNKEEFVPVSPIEICISKLENNEGSLIKWSIPVPPEFASNAVLPLPLIEDEIEADEGYGNNNDAITKTNSPTSTFPSPYTSGRSNNPPPAPPQSLSVELLPSKFPSRCHTPIRRKPPR